MTWGNPADWWDQQALGVALGAWAAAGLGPVMAARIERAWVPADPGGLERHRTPAWATRPASAGHRALDLDALGPGDGSWVSRVVLVLAEGATVQARWRSTVDGYPVAMPVVGTLGSTPAALVPELLDALGRPLVD